MFALRLALSERGWQALALIEKLASWLRLVRSCIERAFLHRLANASRPKPRIKRKFTRSLYVGLHANFSIFKVTTTYFGKYLTKAQPQQAKFNSSSAFERRKGFRSPVWFYTGLTCWNHAVSPFFVFSDSLFRSSFDLLRICTQVLPSH